MPSRSKKEQHLWGSAYGAKKAGKSKPSYVPTSIWNQPMDTMMEFASEVKKSKRKKGKRK